MAVKKLSEITHGVPTTADFVVGVTAGNADRLFPVNSTPLVIGTTPTSGGTDTCILFDKSAIVSEDTNLKWLYNNAFLSVNGAIGVGTGGNIYTLNGAVVKQQLVGDGLGGFGFGFFSVNNNSVGLGFIGAKTRGATPNTHVAVQFTDIITGITAWASDGTSYKQTGSINFQAGTPISTGIVPGNIVFQTTDSTGTLNNVVTIGQDGGIQAQKNVFFGNALANPQYTINATGSDWGHIGNLAASTFFLGHGPLKDILSGEVLTWSNSGIVTISNTLSAGTLQVYNTTDSLSSPTNYERGVFDWTTTANTLTIGTQFGGTGTGRAINFVAGNSLAMSIATTLAITINNSLQVGTGSVGSGANNILIIDKNGLFYMDNIKSATRLSLFVMNAFGTNFGHWYTTGGSPSVLCVGGNNVQTTSPASNQVSASFDVDNFRVGVRNETPNSDLDVSGSFATPAPRTVTAATDSVTAHETTLIFNRAGTVTETLPTASSFPGRWLYFQTVTNNTVVSASSNVVPLGSTTAGTAILAATAGKWARLQSDGTNWIIMAGN